MNDQDRFDYEVMRQLECSDEYLAQLEATINQLKEKENAIVIGQQQGV